MCTASLNSAAAGLDPGGAARRGAWSNMARTVSPRSARQIGRAVSCVSSRTSSCSPSGSSLFWENLLLAIGIIVANVP